MWAILATVVILGAGALGVTTLHESVNESKQFRIQNGSTRGLSLFLDGFPPGASYPETVMLRSDRGALTAAQVGSARSKIAAVPGIASVSRVINRSRDGKLGQLWVTYGGDPVSTVVMQAGLANVDSVMIAGEWRKRDGRLLYDGLDGLRAELARSGQRILSSLGWRPTGGEEART